MKILNRAVAAVALITTVACGAERTTAVPQGNDVQLSSAQATVIRNRIVQLAPVHPELSWLADSVSLVINGGASVTEVPVTTDLGTGPFYAVSLQRTITTSFSGSAAFDVILFNDPSNPTDFIIVSGWTNPNTPTAPPTSVSGVFGAQQPTTALNAHLFHVSGSTVSAWRASAGTAAFNGVSSNGSCAGVTNTSTVTCEQANMHASFNITASSPDLGGSGAGRSASMSGTDIGGIIIRMTIQ